MDDLKSDWNRSLAQIRSATTVQNLIVLLRMDVDGRE